MIDEEMTVRMFGYNSEMLAWKSHKKIVVMCDECGVYRLVEKRDSDRDLCLQCSRKTLEYRNKRSDIMMGEKNPNFGINWAKNHRKNHRSGFHISDKHKQKIRDSNKRRVWSEKSLQKLSDAKKGLPKSDNHKQKISDAHKGKMLSKEHRQHISDRVKGKNHPLYGKNCSVETRQKISAGHQHIHYDEWESFAKEQLYCPKFNESCRESNREKYGRRCFICGKPESENITSTGKVRKLSVHHVDMDKMQGCDGHRWRLVPLCLKHHGVSHNELWTARIIWLLNNVW